MLNLLFDCSCSGILIEKLESFENIHPSPKCDCKNFKLFFLESIVVCHSVDVVRLSENAPTFICWIIQISTFHTCLVCTFCPVYSPFVQSSGCLSDVDLTTFDSQSFEPFLSVFLVRLDPHSSLGFLWNELVLNIGVDQEFFNCIAELIFSSSNAFDFA